MNSCKCGCGTLVEKNYKRGHARRGRKNTAEHNERISLSNKGRVPSEAVRQKMREANLGRVQSEETCRKRRETHRARGVGKWMKGRTLSEETRERISAANKGRGCAEGTRRKISEKNKGFGNGMYGRTHDDPAKEKISAAAKAMWKDPSGKMRAYVGTEAQRAASRKGRECVVLPLKDSSIEVMVQKFLRRRGVEFVTHKCIKDIEHRYQCDIYIPSLNLVIECDGDYWHEYPTGREIDHLRTQELLLAGYNVIRLWEREIRSLKEEQFFEKIDQFAEAS